MLPVQLATRWPWALALTLAGNLGEIYGGLDYWQLVLPFLLGAGWGIAQVLFGLSVARLGLALGYGIIIGLRSGRSTEDSITGSWYCPSCLVRDGASRKCYSDSRWRGSDSPWAMESSSGSDLGDLRRTRLLAVGTALPAWCGMGHRASVIRTLGGAARTRPGLCNHHRARIVGWDAGASVLQESRGTRDVARSVDPGGIGRDGGRNRRLGARGRAAGTGPEA